MQTWWASTYKCWIKQNIKPAASQEIKWPCSRHCMHNWKGTESSLCSFRKLICQSNTSGRRYFMQKKEFQELLIISSKPGRNSRTKCVYLKHTYLFCICNHKFNGGPPGQDEAWQRNTHNQRKLFFIKQDVSASIQKPCSQWGNKDINACLSRF